jgi:hypothetical protein
VIGAPRSVNGDVPVVPRQHLWPRFEVVI